MTITTLLFHRSRATCWRWPRWRSLALTVAFLTVDLAFLSANLVKIEEGGWFPIAIAAAVFALLSTWKRGRDALATMLRESGLPLDLFLSDIARKSPCASRGRRCS